MVGEGECLRHSHASPTSESSPNLIHIWNEWVCGTGKQRQKEECVCVCVRFWRWMLRMGVNGNSDSKAARATVEIKELRFTYPGIDGHPPPGSTPLIQDFSLTLNSGDRCLLVGSNGAGSLSLSLSLAICIISISIQELKPYWFFIYLCLWLLGKTTILKILGGKHMVEPDMVRVLGRSAFHDTTLTSSGDLCYLGGEVSAFISSHLVHGLVYI